MAEKRSTNFVRLALILIVALILRLILWGVAAATEPSRFVDSDTASYWEPARAVAELGTFSRSVNRAAEPETRRTPGYPLFLAGGQLIVGTDPARVALLQLFVGLATVALTWIVARSVAGSRAAPIAALLVAIDPLSIAFSVLLLSEALSAFLLLAAVLAGIRVVQTRGRPAMAIMTGGLVGLSALVRPIGMYLGWSLAIGVLVWAAIDRWSWRRATLAASLVIASFFVIVGGWQMRNALVAGSWEFSSVAPEMMLASVAAPILAEREGITAGEAQARLEHESGGDLASQRWSTVSLILQNPITFLDFRVRWAFRKLIGPGEHRLLQLTGHWGPDRTPGLTLRSMTPGEWLQRWIVPPGLPILAFGWTMTLVVVTNVGLALWLARRLWTRRFEGSELLVLGVLVYFLLIGPPSSRFRIPIMPLVAILAAAGYVRVRDDETGGWLPS